LGVIGHLNSGVAIPSSVKYDEQGLVMVSPANTATAITDRGLKTVNRVCGRDDSQGSAGANYAANELKVKSVYIVQDKTAYGEGVATSFRDTIEGLGVDVQGFEGTEEQSNFDAILTPILAQNPDLLYWGGLYNNGGAALVKQARAKGYKGFIMGADGLDSTDMAKDAGDAAVGVIYTTTAGPASLFPDAKKFIEDYKAEFGIDPQPYAAESYASTQILLAAIEKAAKDAGGLPTREAVAAAVRATKDFATIIGKITFDANGDPTVASYYILKVGSANPDDWGKNEIVQVTTAPSPLTAKAMMAATPAATAAK
jgi:branched-chain amino acid transport system substrate-binding protein